VEGPTNANLRIKFFRDLRANAGPFLLTRS